MPASSPATHPEYELLSVVGTGGFGTVYRAHFRGEGGFTKEVAVKVLREEFGAAEEMVQRLRDEARLLGLLRHRAVVAVDRLLAWENRWALVMEYVEGQDLSQVVVRGPVPVGPMMEIAAEVAGALDVGFHRPGPEGRPLRLLHRDIKPSNIRLTPYGDVKVLDFGVARADFAGREAMTRSVVFGTLEYMAPERLDGQPDGPQADVYALGVVMFEALTGMALGRASATQTRHERKREAAKLALEHVARLPEPAVKLVMEMLAFAPEARPSARMVESRARGLARTFGEESLRVWAERRIGLAQVEATGPVSLPTTPAALPPAAADARLPEALRPAPARIRATRRRPIFAAMATMLFFGVGMIHLVTRAKPMDVLVPGVTRSAPPAKIPAIVPAVPTPLTQAEVPEPMPSPPAGRVVSKRTDDVQNVATSPVVEEVPAAPGHATVRVLGDVVPVCLIPSGGTECASPDAAGRVPVGAYRELCGQFPIGGGEADASSLAAICRTLDVPLDVVAGDRIIVRCSLRFAMCSVERLAHMESP